MQQFKATFSDKKELTLIAEDIFKATDECERIAQKLNLRLITVQSM